MLFLAKKNPLKRLYRISIKSAMVICLPILILIGWMIFDSYLEYKRFADIACKGQAPSFNTDIMHLFLRNSLIKTFVRATASEMPNDENLPTIQMSMDRKNLALLNSDLPKSGKDHYYRAYIKYKGKSYTVKARYMGDNHWHWLYDQKSWRIKTKKSKLIENSRKLNIKNPKTPATLNECVAQDLAKETGLISPRVYPVKLTVNNIYKGVHLFWDPIDESVIRRFNKMPGSVYSGDGAPRNKKSGVSLLWEDEKWWVKSASRNADQKDYRDDIKALVSAVNNPDLKDFHAFADRYLDKEAYASFFSLDNLVACMHHDYHHNHKIYFDPIMGKFEPVSWDIDEWHLPNPKFDAASSPLLNKWKLIPGLDLLRKKRLYELIDRGAFLPDKILRRIDEYNHKIRPALEADVYRDKKYWRGVNILKFRTLPCFPFLLREYDDSVLALKEKIDKRISMLRAYLSQSKMMCSLSELGNSGNYVVRLAVCGNVGRLITGMKIIGSFRSAEIYRDVNRNLVLDGQDILLGKTGRVKGEIVIPLQEEVLPGYKETNQMKSLNNYLFGNHKLEVSPLEYDYIIAARDGTVDNVEIQSQNVVTGQPLDTSYEPIPERIAQETLSLHPWELPPEPAKQSVYLGPGEVIITRTEIYPEHISLTILPGTTIRLGEGISIFCYGKVTAKGTHDRPIRFQPVDSGKVWGVFALQGKGASGSVFEQCSWEGGSEADKNLIYYGGMVSMHGVDHLTIRNCTIGRNYLGDDAIHLAYCKNFIIEGCLFDQARSDALDVDISSGEIAFSRFMNSGNDTLDLMTSNIRVDQCVFTRAGDKGISVGEKTNLAIDGCVFQNCNIGVEIKDKSVVSFERNIFRYCHTAINMYKKNWRYGGGGILKAGNVYAIKCGTNLREDKNSKAQIEAIETIDPDFPVFRKTLSEAALQAPTIAHGLLR
jgi:hypothetical protein